MPQEHVVVSGKEFFLPAAVVSPPPPHFFFFLSTISLFSSSSAAAAAAGCHRGGSQASSLRRIHLPAMILEEPELGGSDDVYAHFWGRTSETPDEISRRRFRGRADDDDKGPPACAEEEKRRCRVSVSCCSTPQVFFRRDAAAAAAARLSRRGEDRLANGAVVVAGPGMTACASSPRGGRGHNNSRRCDDGLLSPACYCIFNASCSSRAVIKS